MAVQIKRVEKLFAEGETVVHVGTGRHAIVVRERVITERVIGRLGVTSHRVDVRMHGSTVTRTYHSHLFAALVESN